MNIQNFDQFSTESLDIFQLDESRSMAKYGLNEFKNLFRGPLLESEGHVDELLLEKAHVCYEMNMLTEAKSHWFETEGEVLKVDAGDHTILIKNNEAYIIATSTLNAINEWWSWEDAKSAWSSFSNKVSTYAKEKIQQAKTVSVKAWDNISSGAKKAWDFIKSCAGAAAKFLSEMSWVEWASLGLGVLSAIFGLIGTAVPGATVIAGVLMVLNGSIHLYEGYHKFDHAHDILAKYGDIGQITRASAAVAQALPNIGFGAIFMALGFYDLSHGLTEAMANPAAGSVSAGIKATAHGITKSYVGKLGHNLEKLMSGGFVKEALEGMGRKITAKAAGVLASNLIAIYGEVFLSKVLGWLWKGLLKLNSQVLSGIDFLLSIPAKITEGITKIQKNATSTIGKIVAKGLATLVKPMTESAAKAIAKHIKPWIKSAKTWLDRQLVAYDVCEKLIIKHNSELEGGAEVPQTKGKTLAKGKELQADPKDLKNIEKLPKINKDIKKAAAASGYEVKKTGSKNESSEYTLKHLDLFEGFDPAI